MKDNRRKLLVIILGLMVAVGPFSIDMYLPAFQIIATHFNTTIGQVGVSMASYFVGMSLGQLLYGPLLDRYGRKAPLYIGLAIYLIATVACILSPSIEHMIVYRFIQAVGGCAASVAAFAIVRDIFPVEENAKIFSSLLLVLSASPLVAPSIGSFVAIAWGWKSVFIILIGIALVVILLIYLFLPQSKGPDPSYSLHPSKIVASFVDVLREPRFFTYAIAGGVSFSGLVVFVANSPFLYMKIFELTEAQFGIMFAVLVGGMIGASQVNTLLMRWYRSDQLVATASMVQVTVGVGLAVVSLAGFATMPILTALIFVYLSSIGIILPNSSALSLEPFSKNTGTASALLGAFQLGIGSIASFIVSVTSSNSSVPMTLSMAVAGLVSIGILSFGRSRIRAIAQ